MSKFLELKDWVYDEIVTIITTMIKFEQDQEDRGLPNRLKEHQQLLEEIKNSEK